VIEAGEPLGGIGDAGIALLRVPVGRDPVELVGDVLPGLFGVRQPGGAKGRPASA